MEAAIHLPLRGQVQLILSRIVGDPTHTESRVLMAASRIKAFILFTPVNEWILLDKALYESSERLCNLCVGQRSARGHGLHRRDHPVYPADDVS